MLGLLATVGTGTFLYAQPSGSGNDNQTGQAAVTIQISVADMTKHIEEMESQVKLDLRHVVHLQQAARKQKDVIKLNCVNDKLIAMKPLANRFDTDRHELDGLLTVGSDQRYAAYASVTKNSDALRKLREEADQCVGEPELRSETENGYTAPQFPIDPTLGNPFDPGIEPPGYASPFN